MNRPLLVLLLAAAAAGQDASPGRDDAAPGSRKVLFVRWRRLPETAQIQLAAWTALEPHPGIQRERLRDFDGDAARAREFFAAHADAAAVLAFGMEAARLAREALPEASVLAVAPSADADVVARTDRDQLAEILRVFAPDARRVACFSPKEESLPGLEVVRCRRPADAAGCRVAWITEDSTHDLRALRRALDAAGIPLVSTSPADPDGLAAVRVRPDPVGLGLRAAALLLGRLRRGQPFEKTHVSRMRVSFDLAAARAAGHEVPLLALARADTIRRGR